jgi:hypothetical protein
MDFTKKPTLSIDTLILKQCLAGTKLFPVFSQRLARHTESFASKLGYSDPGERDFAGTDLTAFGIRFVCSRKGMC